MIRRADPKLAQWISPQSFWYGAELRGEGVTRAGRRGRRQVEKEESAPRVYANGVKGEITLGETILLFEERGGP